jgi:hypothetical protein
MGVVGHRVQHRHLLVERHLAHEQIGPLGGGPAGIHPPRPAARLVLRGGGTDKDRDQRERQAGDQRSANDPAHSDLTPAGSANRQWPAAATPARRMTFDVSARRRRCQRLQKMSERERAAALDPKGEVRADVADVRDLERRSNRSRW